MVTAEATIATEAPSKVRASRASGPASHVRTPAPRRSSMRHFLRFFMRAYHGACRLARAVGQHPRSPRGPATILLTGTFHAAAWAVAHLRPLAAARSCRELVVVSTLPLPPMHKVRVIAPPRGLVRALGNVPARMLTFAAYAWWTRPDVVGGFHLLLNGLLAQLVARCVGARAWYYSVGGPAEFAGGGVTSENRLFARIGAPDSVVEAQLLDAVRGFDTIITMGTRAADFFRAAGVSAPIHVMPGGMDAARFAPSAAAPDFDVVFVGRLAPIKRVDLLLRSFRLVVDALPQARLAIVGVGPLGDSLQRLAVELQISENVHFAGHQRNVAAWLQRSRVFVLTSETEGLSLSLMEAALCGLPAVVPAVGDLGDLVEHGVNGYLLRDHSPAAFAAALSALLTDQQHYAAMSAASRQTGLKFELSAAVARWNAALSPSGSSAPAAPSGEGR